MGTKRLNDVVAEIVGDVIAGRAINKRQAAIDNWTDIDADGQYLAGIDGVVARIDRRARALQVKAERAADDSQPALPFQLPAAVAMDLEGTTLVATRVLSREEFVRAMEIRRKQISNDNRALREWKQALKQADRFWADHPSWSFGQTVIRDRLGVLSTKGYVKFVRGTAATEIGLAAERSKYGYLCVEGMELGTGAERVDAATGEVGPELIAVLPSHYKCPQTGAVLPVENPAVWVYREEDLA